MSTYWDLVCTEHGEAAGIHWNHGEDQLALVARQLSVWASLADMYQEANGYLFSCASHNLFACESGPSLESFAQWAKRHAGCLVLPKNEYGDWHGQCSERVVCGACGTWHKCGLSREHSGAHVRRDKP